VHIELFIFLRDFFFTNRTGEDKTQRVRHSPIIMLVLIAVDYKCVTG